MLFRSEHIIHRVSQSIAKTNLILRNIKTKNPEVLVKIYRTYIQSSLLYASPIFASFYSDIIKRMDHVFHHFWRVAKCRPPSFLLRPSEMMIVNDMMLCWRIFNRKTCYNFYQLFEFTTHPINTRYADQGMLKVPQFQKATSLHSFPIRCAKLLNLMHPASLLMDRNKFRERAATLAKKIANRLPNSRWDDQSLALPPF